MLCVVNILSVPPEITPFNFGGNTVNAGDSVSATCSVHKGDLPINISWLHNNVSIGYNDGIVISSAGKKISTMAIDSVDESHSGTYTCLAANRAGKMTYSALLYVNGTSFTFKLLFSNVVALFVNANFFCNSSSSNSSIQFRRRVCKLW